MKEHGGALEVRFWGVRGSIPSPGPDTSVVGGNTACLEITGGGSRVVIDCGSGMRALGDHLMKLGDYKRVCVLMTHVHWDHVMGLPFFTPLYVPGVEISMGSGPLGAPLLDVLRGQMKQPMFPVDFTKVGAKVSTFDILLDQPFSVGALDVRVASLNHPDPVLAFRVSYGGRSVVFATDTEHVEGQLDGALVELARGADVLIYDAQYTPEEYAGEVGPPKHGWGHSTYAAGAAVAKAAGAKTLALFHHDPRRTDEGVAEIVRRSRELFPETVAAREGLSMRFEARGQSLPPMSERTLAALGA